MNQIVKNLKGNLDMIRSEKRGKRWVATINCRPVVFSSTLKAVTYPSATRALLAAYRYALQGDEEQGRPVCLGEPDPISLYQ
jgi:hypothetical protein